MVPGPLQFGDLRVPPGEGPFPLALVLHGGYWQATYNLIHTGHLCEALRDAGIASWNVEYRCVGIPGGEWPAARKTSKGRSRTSASCHSPTTAARCSSVTPPAASSRFWAAKRSGLTRRGPGAGLRRPATPSSAAAPESAPGRFMAPEHFADGSPLELLPLGARQIVIHGDADDDVPTR
jgi:hypothetical protein